MAWCQTPELAGFLEEQFFFQATYGPFLWVSSGDPALQPPLL